MSLIFVGPHAYEYMYFDYGYFLDYGTWHTCIQCINEHINEHAVDTSVVAQFKVTGYLEEMWFKKNFAKVFSACSYYYASVVTVILRLSGVYRIS